MAPRVTSERRSGSNPEAPASHATQELSLKTLIADAPLGRSIAGFGDDRRLRTVVACVAGLGRHDPNVVRSEHVEAV